MANPQKDLQEEEINKKKQEALANIELELKFKKVLDKNPVFKLGFDADRFYVQKEPRSDKERLNIGGLYYAPSANLEKFKGSAQEYPTEAGRNIYREIVKAIENKEIPENDFVFMPHDMEPGDRTKFSLTGVVEESKLEELSGAVSVRNIFDQEYEETSVMHEFMHRALRTNPALIEWKKENNIDNLDEELIMHRMTMKYHPNMADSTYDTVLNAYGVDLKQEYNQSRVDGWINDIERISIDELRKQGKSFDDINFFAKNNGIYVQTDKMMNNPNDIVVTELPEKAQEDKKINLLTFSPTLYILEKLYGYVFKDKEEDLEAKTEVIPGVSEPKFPLPEEDIPRPVDELETKADPEGTAKPLDADWFLSKDMIDKLKSESYVNQYAQGKVGKEKGFQLPLGYRTNNWLSQHQLGQNWDGRSKIKDDKIIFPGHDKETHKVIEVFDDPSFGMRAGMVDVMSKALQNGSPMITLQMLIDSKYMQDPTPYLAVAKQKGYGLNDKFNLFDKSQAMEWYAFMLQSEMGSFSFDIPANEKEKVFEEGYRMAMERMANTKYKYHPIAVKYLDSSQ